MRAALLRDGKLLLDGAFPFMLLISHVGLALFAAYTLSATGEFDGQILGVLALIDNLLIASLAPVATSLTRPFTLVKYTEKIHMTTWTRSETIDTFGTDGTVMAVELRTCPRFKLEVLTTVSVATPLAAVHDGFHHVRTGHLSDDIEHGMQGILICGG